MIYLHYCKTCRKLYLLAGHPAECPRCGSAVDELKISYTAYSSLTPYEREELLVRLENDLYLESLRRPYRFARRTKRYHAASKKTGNPAS